MATLSTLFAYCTQVKKHMSSSYRCTTCSTYLFRFGFVCFCVTRNNSQFVFIPLHACVCVSACFVYAVAVSTCSLVFGFVFVCFGVLSLGCYDSSVE